MQISKNFTVIWRPVSDRGSAQEQSDGSDVHTVCRVHKMPGQVVVMVQFLFHDGFRKAIRVVLKPGFFVFALPALALLPLPGTVVPAIQADPEDRSWWCNSRARLGK